MATPQDGIARTTFASSAPERVMYERMAARESVTLSEWIRRTLNDRAAQILLRDALKVAGQPDAPGIDEPVGKAVENGVPAGT